MYNYILLGDKFKNTENGWITDFTPEANMYHKNSHQELLTAFVTAGLGAGIITSFAISQGQHPLVGIGITAFAAVAAIICDRVMSL
ncbi:MAG: hypothetical protein ACRCT1_10530 [Microcoleaceae cyanobacterium]